MYLADNTRTSSSMRIDAPRAGGDANGPNAFRIRLIVLDVDGVLTTARCSSCPTGTRLEPCISRRGRSGGGAEGWCDRGGPQRGGHRGSEARCAALRDHAVHMGGQGQAGGLQSLTGDMGIAMDETCYVGRRGSRRSGAGCRRRWHGSGPTPQPRRVKPADHVLGACGGRGAVAEGGRRPASKCGSGRTAELS